MWFGRGYPYRTQLLVTMVFLSLKDLPHSQGNADYTLTVQQSVTVQEGLCVTVPCTFTIDSSKKLSTNAIGYWRKCSYTNKDKCSAEPPPDKQPRIHMTNVSNGDCSFTLNDPDKRDTGKYEFRIEDGVDKTIKFSYVNNPTYITVTDLTDKPEIILPEVMVAGKDVSLTCKSPGRSCGTSPIFSWEKNGVQAKSDPIITCGEKNMSLSDCKEPNITLRLTRNDHQTSITCNVTLPVVGRSTSKNITLNVQYPPSISITGIEGNDTMNKLIDVEEGTSVNLTFLADSNPPADVVLMRGMDPLVSTFTGQKLNLHLTNVTLNEAGTYNISASNQRGNSNGSLCITVKKSTTRPKEDVSSTPNQDGEKFNIQIRDVMIGFLCGIIFALFVILMVTFITRKRKNLKQDRVPLSEDKNHNDLYMNVSPAAQGTPKPPMRNRNTEQNKPMDVSDEQSVNYASINFSGIPSSPKVNSSEPVYAEVKKNHLS